MRIPALIFILPACFAAFGCGKGSPESRLPAPVREIRQALAAGDYDEALHRAETYLRQVPPPSGLEEILFLKAYALTYGKSDFQGARAPLNQLLDHHPRHPRAVEARRMLADGFYWQGLYEEARAQYRRLTEEGADAHTACYARLQAAHCHTLAGRIGEALAAYRKVVEECHADPLGDVAQLMVANLYVRIENPGQARTEFQRLAARTQNQDLRRAARREVRRLEEEAALHRGVGFPRSPSVEPAALPEGGVLEE